MTEEELLRRHPRLWHMAADGLWPSIQHHGLLSVSSLLDLHGITGSARHAIEGQRRPQCVTLNHPVHGKAVIRDNKPMTDAGLVKCLKGGLVPEDWYRTLNGKSFFWVSEDLLVRLLQARAYKKDPQTVIEVDTQRLLERHRERVRLARINTGNTGYVPSPRDASTFKTIADYPDGVGALGSKQKPRIVELVVEGGLPDLADLGPRLITTT